MGQSHPPPCGRKEESHGGVLSYKSWVGGEEEPQPPPLLNHFPQFKQKSPPFGKTFLITRFFGFFFGIWNLGLVFAGAGDGA